MPLGPRAQAPGTASPGTGSPVGGSVPSADDVEPAGAPAEPLIPTAHDGPGEPGEPGAPGDGAASAATRPPAPAPASNPAPATAGIRPFRTRHLVAAGVGAALLAGGVAGGLVGSLVTGSGGAAPPSTASPAPALRSGAGQALGPVPGVAAEALHGTVTIDATGPGVHSVGTGFFFDSAGHILTNAHVVEPEGKPGKLTVDFPDGTSSPASVVGAATGYDIAVVKLDGFHAHPQPLALGDSDHAVVGEPVVAAGAPFDLAGTVTSGIISALDRPVTTHNGAAAAYLSALQTDAPINPGNSGGPLLDDAGQVIGVNSAISGAPAPAGAVAGSVGLGFAIPIDQAKWVADGILVHGTVPYAQLGLRVNEAYGGQGVQIASASVKPADPALTPGGPAAEAGMRPGDVITAFDGRPVDNGDALMSAVRACHPHDRADVTFIRGGHAHTVGVVLGEGSGNG